MDLMPFIEAARKLSIAKEKRDGRSVHIFEFENGQTLYFERSRDNRRDELSAILKLALQFGVVDAILQMSPIRAPGATLIWRRVQPIEAKPAFPNQNIWLSVMAAHLFSKEA